MNIPAQYQWVVNMPNKPKMIEFALKLVGIKEYPGKLTNNPEIMKMAKELGIPSSVFPNDETAWCAVAHNYVCLHCGKPLSYTSSKNDIYDLLRARSFLKWGISSAIPMFGDTMVFKRPQGEHVGLNIGEDLTTYHILGGNQGNSYGFMRMEKKRLIEARRFYAVGPPASVRQYILSPIGNISVNEA